MDFENVKLAAEHMKQAERLLSRGPFGYYLVEMSAAYDLLMNRFAPFKVGDQAHLAADIALGPNSGWHHWRHFFKKGQPCRVVSAECGSHGFRFGIQFDADTDERKATFTVNEADLVMPNTEAKGPRSGPA